MRKLKEEGWEEANSRHEDLFRSPIFTKGDYPRRRVSIPRTMLLTPLHTKPEGRWRAGEPPMLQGGRRTEIQVWFTLEPQHKDLNIVWSLTQELT